MKAIKYSIIAFATAFTLSACGDFFEESSQDEVKAKTTADLASMMYSAAYPYTTLNTDGYLRLLTDEVQCNGLTDKYYTTYLKNGQPVFCFSKTMFDGLENFIDDEDSWGNYYEKIKGCNAVLDYVDDVSGTESEKNALKAQVLFLRGYYYLKLAMIYCKPYAADTTNPDTDLGVVLQLTSEVTDEQHPRSTLKETFSQIEADLLEAERLIPEYYPEGLVPFRANIAAVDLTLARMYLYMGEWAKAAEHATKAINEGPKLTNMNTLANSFGSLNNRIYDAERSQEVVFTYGNDSWQDNHYFVSQAASGGDQPWVVSKELLAKFDAANDLRYKMYDEWGFKVMVKTGFVHTYKAQGDMGIRMAEAYLIRAEADMRLVLAGGSADLRQQAISDLNNIRANRYVTGSNYAVDTTRSDDDMLRFVLDERQRELCWENGTRWFDIKRLGLSVSHTYIDASGNATEFTLPAGSPLYALPIPYEAIDRNGKLEQNAR